IAEQFLSWMSLDDKLQSKGNVIYVGPPMEQIDQLIVRMDFHRAQMHYRFYTHPSLQIVVQASESIPTDISAALEIRNDILKSVMGNNRDGVQHHTQRLVGVIERTQPELGRLHVYIFETIGLIIGYARDKNYAGMDQYEQQYLNMDRIKSCLHIDCL